MNEIEDVHLVADAQAGDRNALDLLCDRYKDRLYHYIIKHLGQGNADLSDEIFQETWKRAIKKLKSFKGKSDEGKPADFLTWLIGFAKWCRHEIVEKQQKYKKVVGSLEEKSQIDKNGNEMPFEVVALTSTPVEDCIKNEEVLQLKKAIESLPEIYRIPCYQKLLWGVEISQIVHNMNASKKDNEKVNANTIKKQLERGYKMLTEILEGK